jgi:hypothetical protein
MALHFFPDSQNYIEFIDWQGTVACYKIQHLKALKNREIYESYHHTFRKLLSCREWQEINRRDSVKFGADYGAYH